MTDGLEDATPTCPLCFHLLEPAGDERAPYWWCPDCDYVALSV